jgi:hypothetical protein
LFASLLMHEYPLDIRGLILRHLQPNQDYRWVAPFLWSGEIELRAYLDDPALLARYRVLLEVDCSGQGRIIPRAVGIAARQGRLTLAHNLMAAHIRGIRPEMELEARALSLLNDEKRKVRRLLNRNREWPKDVWNLHDTPAWIIPAFIRRFRQQVNSRPISIISGGHLLAAGNWMWDIATKSHLALQATPYEYPNTSLD